jgi:hypothetical protein
MNINDVAKTIVDELDHFQTSFRNEGGALGFAAQASLAEEPLIGYALASNPQEKKTTILLCRNAIPTSHEPKARNTEYASSFSPLGRIITRSPGETHEFVVTHRRTGFVLEDHIYTLVEKDEFRSRRTDDDRFDAEDNRFTWVGGSALARSLRALLAGQVDRLPSLRRRRVRVQLPDVAILDAAQDDLFRLPFNRRLRISGAPGTGKTTVLLKRLSQKTKYEFLTESEQRLATQAEWDNGKNWMLFTPSDLLKSYLKEALNKELLPADEEHVKVYSTFRNTMLREIRFQGGTNGYFRVAAGDVNLLKRATGNEHVLLTRAVGRHLADRVSDAWRTAIQRFNNETRVPLGQLADASQQILIKGSETIAEAGTDVVELLDAQRRFRSVRELTGKLNEVVRQIRRVGAHQDTDQSVSLPFLYRQYQQLLALISTVNLENVETALFPTLPPLVGDLQKALRDLADAIAIRRLFESIPRGYQEFREDRTNHERYFTEDARTVIRDKQLSPAEQDTLLFHALEFVCTLSGEFGPALTGVPAGIQLLLDRNRLLIAIDEVTDFSAVQVACMERFAPARNGGVTISGDILQRVTRQGLKRWDEIDELSQGFAGTELTVSYRQTARLFAIAKDLFAHVTGEIPNFRSAHDEDADDPEPLWFRPTKQMSAAHWVSDRITEICDLCDGHLPTTAILVSTREDVQPVCAALRTLLNPHGIEIQASEDGQALGDGDRVRVFPIEFIKGLEFEVAFYVGLDRMADVHEELIDKYFYVGLSRARSFLGVTCERSPKQLPKTMQVVHGHFSDRLTFTDDKETADEAADLTNKATIGPE